MMAKQALVVDSDYFFVEFLAELLEKRGYSVKKAYDGKEAISLLSEPVDIVFADLIMPKVDGRRLIDFIRMKYQDAPFPIVAVSGAMIEQVGALNEIGADYYIAKGRIDQLTVQLNEFLAEMETQPFFPPPNKKILETGNVFPRRDAVELINSLHFHQAVIESIGVGVILVDTDTRIFNANCRALEIIGRSPVDILNCPVTKIFANGDGKRIVAALNQARHQSDAAKTSFYTSFNKQLVKTIITPLVADHRQAGWVVALEDD